MKRKTFQIIQFFVMTNQILILCPCRTSKGSFILKRSLFDKEKAYILPFRTRPKLTLLNKIQKLKSAIAKMFQVLFSRKTTIFIAIGLVLILFHAQHVKACPESSDECPYGLTYCSACPKGCWYVFPKTIFSK